MYDESLNNKNGCFHVLFPLCCFSSKSVGVFKCMMNLWTIRMVAFMYLCCLLFSPCVIPFVIPFMMKSFYNLCEAHDVYLFYLLLYISCLFKIIEYTLSIVKLLMQILAFRHSLHHFLSNKNKTTFNCHKIFSYWIYLRISF